YKESSNQYGVPTLGRTNLQDVMLVPQGGTLGVSEMLKGVTYELSAYIQSATAELLVVQRGDLLRILGKEGVSELAELEENGLVSSRREDTKTKPKLSLKTFVESNMEVITAKSKSAGDCFYATGQDAIEDGEESDLKEERELAAKRAKKLEKAVAMKFDAGNTLWSSEDLKKGIDANKVLAGRLLEQQGGSQAAAESGAAAAGGSRPVLTSGSRPSSAKDNKLSLVLHIPTGDRAPRLSRFSMDSERRARTPRNPLGQPSPRLTLVANPGPPPPSQPTTHVRLPALPPNSVSAIEQRKGSQCGKNTSACPPDKAARDRPWTANDTARLSRVSHPGASSKNQQQLSSPPQQQQQQQQQQQPQCASPPAGEEHSAEQETSGRKSGSPRGGKGSEQGSEGGPILRRDTKHCPQIVVPTAHFYHPGPATHPLPAFFNTMPWGNSDSKPSTTLVHRPTISTMLHHNNDISRYTGENDGHLWAARDDTTNGKVQHMPWLQHRPAPPSTAPRFRPSSSRAPNVRPNPRPAPNGWWTNAQLAKAALQERAAPTVNGVEPVMPAFRKSRVSASRPSTGKPVAVSTWKHMRAWERFCNKKSPDAAQQAHDETPQKRAMPERDQQKQMMMSPEEQEQMTKIQERIQANKVAAIKGMSPRSQDSYAFVDSPNNSPINNALSPKGLNIASEHIRIPGMAGSFHHTLM
ncbi:hypothetical protein CYMTET_7590, partial [Cymbomonas tetramitiformis]